MLNNPTPQIEPRKGLVEFEFIALMAFLMSNVALSIDAVLPALSDIGSTIRVEESASLQLIISMIFIGLGLGQLILGILSDSFGRKTLVYCGVGLFTLASILCVFAPNLEIMLIARVLQGLGLAAPRTMSVSIIRDSYIGDKMARIMSFVMGVFILVPMIAPILGQAILSLFHWQAIIYFQLIFIFVTLVWFKFRQKETLPREKRVRISRKTFFYGIKEFFLQRNTVVFTLISGLIEGAFILYLSTSPTIFQGQYNRVDEFPFIFMVISLVLGISAYLNGALVDRFGMKKLVIVGLGVFSLSSLIYCLLFWSAVNPPLLILLLFIFVQFAALGFIIGNLSALAMEPIGHIAGTGSALFSFISTMIAAPLAIFLGKFITDSVLPLFLGFLITAGLSIVLFLFREKSSGST